VLPRVLALRKNDTDFLKKGVTAPHDCMTETNGH